MATETDFIKELKLMFMNHANDNGMNPPTIINMHGSVIMAGVPDLYIAIGWHGLWIEAKIRKTPPVKTFALDAGVKPNQRTMMESLSLNGDNVFLAVKVSKDVAIFTKIVNRSFADMKISPTNKLPSWCIELNKPSNGWIGVGNILNACD